MDSDWDLSIDEWRLMSRCTKCARQLYPYSQARQDAWAEMAYKKCIDGMSSPEALRDKQSPGITQLIAKRPPRSFSYR